MVYGSYLAFGLSRIPLGNPRALIISFLRDAYAAKYVQITRYETSVACQTEFLLLNCTHKNKRWSEQQKHLERRA